MPHISEIKDSKYLKKEDVGEGVLVTIGECEQVDVAMQGNPQELKWALHFDELEKPMILNSTNAQVIAAILGSDVTENWIGKKVVLYTDHTIAFQGRLVGGIRVRAVRGKAAAAIKGAPTPAAAKPKPAAAKQAPATQAPATRPSPPANQEVLETLEEVEDDENVPF